MLIARMPISIFMQRQAVNHPWADMSWFAVGALPDPGNFPPVLVLHETPTLEQYLVSGLQLELHPDENDGYFENWVAPEPKVFVMWRMIEHRAMPVVASVSYGEGARMLDSGEAADGVPMAADIYAWLGQYLQTHYHPEPRRGRDRSAGFRAVSP